MKMRATIIESPEPNEKILILSFEKDPNKQHFEVKCSFSPFLEKLRKWDLIEVVIKFESEIFIEPKTGKKSYFTHLTCEKYKEINSPFRKDK